MKERVEKMGKILLKIPGSDPHADHLFTQFFFMHRYK